LEEAGVGSAEAIDGLVRIADGTERTHGRRPRLRVRPAGGAGQELDQPVLARVDILELVN